MEDGNGPSRWDVWRVQIKWGIEDTKNRQDGREQVKSWRVIKAAVAEEHLEEAGIRTKWVTTVTISQ
jgi:hypothetical protein